MPKIEISRDHNLPREELEPRIESYLTHLRDQKLKMMNFQYAWKDDRNGLSLSGTGFTGDVVLRPNGVDIVIDLSLMLAPFKGSVEESLQRGLERSLTK